jgi:hypothetical protein
MIGGAACSSVLAGPPNLISGLGISPSAQESEQTRRRETSKAPESKTAPFPIRILLFDLPDIDRESLTF